MVSNSNFSSPLFPFLYSFRILSGSLSLSPHFLLGVGFSSLYDSELKPKIFGARKKSERAVKVMGKPAKFEGVSEELQKILDADMDQVGPRRRAREAFKDIQLSIDHILFKVFANLRSWDRFIAQ